MRKMNQFFRYFFQHYAANQSKKWKQTEFSVKLLSIFRLTLSWWIEKIRISVIYYSDLKIWRKIIRHVCVGGGTLCVFPLHVEYVQGPRINLNPSHFSRSLLEDENPQPKVQFELGRILTSGHQFIWKKLHLVKVNVANVYLVWPQSEKRSLCE